MGGPGSGRRRTVNYKEMTPEQKRQYHRDKQLTWRRAKRELIYQSAEAARERADRLVAKRIKATVKYCPACAQSYPHTQEFFYYSGKYSSPFCRNCTVLRQKLRIHGLSFEQYRQLTHGGACMICGETNGTLHIDHDHLTGQVRGALCRECNLGLGNFDDDPVLLSAALDYLTR